MSRQKCSVQTKGAHKIIRKVKEQGRNILFNLLILPTKVRRWFNLEPYVFPGGDCNSGLSLLIFYSKRKTKTKGRKRGSIYFNSSSIFILFLRVVESL